MLRLIFFMFMGLFLGCGAEGELPGPLTEVQESQEDSEGPRGPREPFQETPEEPPIKRIFSEKKIKSNVNAHVGNLQVGDVLEIHFHAKERPPFKKLEEFTYPSEWEEEECINLRSPSVSPICDFRVSEHRRGHCTLYYRRGTLFVLRTMRFDNGLGNVSLRFRIGNNLYPVGEIIKNLGDEVSARLTVTEEMLRSGSTAYLTALPRGERSIKMGFIKYGPCEGLGKKNFRHEGTTSSQYHSISDKHVYYVTLYIDRREEDQ